jgi:hypothetical protein
METVHGFVVTTVCKTVDEFVERYHSRVAARTLFVGVIEPRALSGECAFAILLADKSVALAGVCEVLDVYPHNANIYGRRGMRLAIRRLGFESEYVWEKLIERCGDDHINIAVDAAIAAATSRLAAASISSNDLSQYAREFDEQTTLPHARGTGNLVAVAPN